MSRGERTPSVSLVIATYNWPVALDRVLASVLAQQSPPEQVLIADDGSTADTARVVERWRPAFGERLVHVWRPDDGFRAGEVRNRAARDATGNWTFRKGGYARIGRSGDTTALAMQRGGKDNISVLLVGIDR